MPSGERFFAFGDSSEAPFLAVLRARIRDLLPAAGTRPFAPFGAFLPDPLAIDPDPSFDLQFSRQRKAIPLRGRIPIRLMQINTLSSATFMMRTVAPANAEERRGLCFPELS